MKIFHNIMMIESGLSFAVQRRGIRVFPLRQREKEVLTNLTESKVMPSLDPPLPNKSPGNISESPSIKEEPPLSTDNLFMAPNLRLPLKKTLGESKSKISCPIHSVHIDVKSFASFSELPGPSVLKVINKGWAYIPIIGAQASVSFLTQVQDYFQSLGKRFKWLLKMRPFNYLFEEYGPVVRIGTILGGDVVLIKRTEEVRSLIQSLDTPTGASSLVDSLDWYRKLKLPAPLPLTFTEGQGDKGWLKLRETLKEKLQFKAGDFIGIQEQISDELVTKIFSERTAQEEFTDEFRVNMFKWGLECMSVTLFNELQGFLELGHRSASVTEASRMLPAFLAASEGLSACETGLQVWRLFPTKGWNMLTKSCDILEGFLCRNMRTSHIKLDKMANGIEDIKAPSLVQALILNENLTPEQTLTKLFDIFLIGVNMAVNSASFVLYFLAKYSRVQNKLFKELIESLPNQDSKFTLEEFQKQKYLMACVIETLRLKTPFPFMIRILEKDVIIHGYRVPKGTHLLMANIMELMSEEKFEEPERFLPERWHLEFPLSVEDDPFAAAPISNDISRQIILQQIAVLTAKIVRNFSLEYHYGPIYSENRFLAPPNRSFKLRAVDRAQ